VDNSKVRLGWKGCARPRQGWFEGVGYPGGPMAADQSPRRGLEI
jgi:hypothetical protein